MSELMELPDLWAEMASAGRRASPMDLRALTFNIRYDTARDGSDAWPHRKDLVFRMVERLSCHLIGFQEVLPQQRADLEEAMPEYRWLGRGRDADGGGEQCCVAVAPGLEILDEGTFWLSPQPDIPGAVGWDAQITRICTWARLRKDGAEFHFFNAHWDHKGETARTETARLLLDRVLRAPGPVLLAGDFNTTPDSKPLDVLTGGLQDSFAEIHPGSTQPTFQGFGSVTDGPRIDYLLASPEFVVIDSEVISQTEGPYPSDHFPVFARYELHPS